MIVDLLGELGSDRIPFSFLSTWRRQQQKDENEVELLTGNEVRMKSGTPPVIPFLTVLMKNFNLKLVKCRLKFESVSNSQLLHILKKV